MTTADTAISTVAWAGCPPRLLTENREDLAAYRERGGYRRLADAEELLAEVDASGLLGRGGGAFPLAVKLRTVRTNGRVRGSVVIANGEEGEPASVKDRWLLRNRPHLVLDGLRLAAAVVGAERAYVFVSDVDSARSVEAALGEFDLPGVSIVVWPVEPGYVAGEETAAVHAINGGPAKPTDKPPRPFEAGVADKPTLVSNVETLAALAYIHQHGSAVFRTQGTAQSPGTFLATVTGAGRPAVLYELPHGVPFTELIALHDVSSDQLRGVLMGGYFAGLVNRRVLDTTLDHETIRGIGSGLGCGAISLITDECPVAVAASVLEYFDRENAGQCGSCFNGTAAMASACGALRDGAATTEDLERLRRWSVVLRSRGACGTLDAACNIAASLFDQFPDEVTRHLDGSCPDCTTGAFRAERPYEAVRR